MKVKLMVSYDAGLSYEHDMEMKSEEDAKLMAKRTVQLDEEGLRWVIENEEGDIIEASKIHRTIISMIDKLNK